MDPTAAYRLWLAALADHDEAAAIDHADDLKQWYTRGGFDPLTPAARTRFDEWCRRYHL